MSRYGLILAAVVTSAGCAHLKTVDDGLDYASRRARLEDIGAWEMRGRLTVDADGDAYQGRFSWRQEADHLVLSFWGPLGAGRVRIAGTPAALTVSARRDSWALTDPETQLSELLGWWVPVNSLKAWLLGLPDSAYEAMPVWDAQGRLAGLEQRLWTLHYPAYQLAEDLSVPRRIDMNYDALRLKLTVDDWIAEADSLTP